MLFSMLKNVSIITAKKINPEKKEILQCLFNTKVFYFRQILKQFFISTVFISQAPRYYYY